MPGSESKQVVSHNLRMKLGNDRYAKLLSMLREDKSGAAIGREFGWSRQHANNIKRRLTTREVTLTLED